MSSENTNSSRLYYSLKEVAEMLNEHESTVRYWEKVIPYLHSKTAKDSRIRQYTTEDIERLQLVRNLVRVQGLRIFAASKLLKTTKGDINNNTAVLDKLVKVHRELTKIRDFIGSDD